MPLAAGDSVRLLEDIHALPLIATATALRSLADRIAALCAAADTDRGSAVAAIAVAASFTRKVRRVLHHWLRSAKEGLSVADDVVSASGAPARALEHCAMLEATTGGLGCSLLRAEVEALLKATAAGRSLSADRLRSKWRHRAAEVLIGAHPMGSVGAGATVRQYVETVLRQPAGAAVVVSTRDPLSLAPISAPARCTSCRHTQPFDLGAFMLACGQLNAVAPCPVCRAPVDLAKVHRDVFLLQHIGAGAGSVTLHPATNSVEVEGVGGSDSEGEGEGGGQDEVAAHKRPRP